MLRQLLINFAVLTALSYMFSLMFQQWPVTQDRNYRLRSMLLVALMSLLLLQIPAEIAPGILIDMRSVPVILLALVYGGRAALLVSLPMLLYRTLLGGAGVGPGFISHAMTVGAALLVRRQIPAGQLQLSARQLLLPSILMFLPNGLPLLTLPGGPGIFAQAYPPLLLLNVAGFMLAYGILKDRLDLLRLQASLSTQVYQDQLSGLHNRRQFDHDLATLQPGDLILMVDIDHFKGLNDSLGHAAGDQALEQVAATLRRTTRGTDRAYRYGGEEFAVILRHPAPDAAGNIAERFRTAIANTPLRLEIDGSEIERPVTVSVGVATVRAQPAEALARADAALYQAKRSGRNRSCICPSEQDPAPPS